MNKDKIAFHKRLWQCWKQDWIGHVYLAAIFLWLHAHVVKTLLIFHHFLTDQKLRKTKDNEHFDGYWAIYQGKTTHLITRLLTIALDLFLAYVTLWSSTCRCISFTGLNRRAQDVRFYFGINVLHSYGIAWHYQTAVLARKWLNANTSVQPPPNVS